MKITQGMYDGLKRENEALKAKVAELTEDLEKADRLNGMLQRRHSSLENESDHKNSEIVRLRLLLQDIGTVVKNG